MLRKNKGIIAFQTKQVVMVAEAPSSGAFRGEVQIFKPQGMFGVVDPNHKETKYMLPKKTWFNMDADFD